MKRREALGALGAGAAGLAALSAGGATAQEPAKHQGHDHAMAASCLKACSDCMNACNMMFHHCFELTKQGKTEHALAAHLAVDCAEFCSTSATLIGRHSPLMGTACAACAEACDACAAECEKHDDPMMKECAKECRRCAESCRAMVKAMGSHGNAAAPK